MSTYLGPKGVEYDIKVMRTFDREVEMDIVLLTMFEKYCKVHFKNHVKIVLNNNEKIDEPQHTGRYQSPCGCRGAGSDYSIIE